MLRETWRMSPFNPLPSHEGRLCAVFTGGIAEPFNPLPSHEGRLFCLRKVLGMMFFQSTSLSRGKTNIAVAVALCNHLSIHFPLTREDASFDISPSSSVLSIHFPLTREDKFDHSVLLSYRLSIHFPLTREDT